MCYDGLFYKRWVNKLAIWLVKNYINKNGIICSCFDKTWNNNNIFVNQTDSCYCKTVISNRIKWQIYPKFVDIKIA